VAVADDLRVTSTLVVPAGELSWRFSRSSGPGGQGVNTTDSRVELSFDVERSAALSTALSPGQRERVLRRLGPRLVDGVLTLAAEEQRSQLRNREAAQDRMAQLLREALAPPPPPRRPTKPTRGSQQRRLDAKARRGETKRMRRPPQD
jgi:ribosome-associated protein